MTLLEKLRELDKQSFDNGTTFYDLQSLYEGARLSAEHKAELKKIIDSTDDTQKASALAGAYIQTIEAQKNESVDACDSEDEGCVMCEECGEEKKVNPQTGNYYCPHCEQYLVESDCDRDDFIGEDFFYDDGENTYFAKWNEDVINDKENYDIFAIPSWADADDDTAWDYLFTVDSLTTVGEVIDEINSNFNESLNCCSGNLSEDLLTEGKNIEKTWEQYKTKIIDRFNKMDWFTDSATEEDYKKSWESTILSCDPTYKRGSSTTGDFGIWLTNMFIQDKRINREYAYNLLNEFRKKKPNLEKKDINQYKSYEELENALKNTQLSDRQKQRQLQNMRNVEGADTLFQDNKWTVYSPNTYEASCALRKGASWCTGSTTDDHWYNRYTKDGKLYIIINNEDPKEKYQAYIKNGKTSVKEFRNAQNDAVNFRKFVTEVNPDLGEFFYGNGIVTAPKEGESDNPKLDALAEYLEVSTDDITSEHGNWFSVIDNEGRNREYLVLDDGEAEEYYQDDVVNMLQDEWGYDNCYDLLLKYINDDVFQYQYEGYLEDTARDMSYNHPTSRGFENELTEYLYDEGVITDKDFFEDENGVDHSLCTLTDDVLIDKYIEHESELEDAMDWFEEYYDTDAMKKDFVSEHYNHIDFEGAAQEFIRTDWSDRGEYISGYDGVEHELPRTEDGEQYYAYRMQ